MRASPPSRRHTALAFLAALLPVALIALAGCGSSSDTTAESTSGSETGSPPASQSTSKAPLGASVRSCPNSTVSNAPIRVAGASCAEGTATAGAWAGNKACLQTASASRSSCTAGRFRCLSVRTGPAIAVNCSRPGRSVTFRVEVSEPEAAGQ